MEPSGVGYRSIGAVNGRSPLGMARPHVARETMATQVERRLAEAVLAGEVMPGDRLVEADLAAEMQTSRGPVREALRQLSETGLVNYVPRRGWFVTRLREEDRVDIVIMRGNLEGYAARLACARYRAGEVTFEPLRRVLHQMQTDVEATDAKSFFVHDWDFHEELCIASGNAWLHKSWLMMRHGISLLVANSQVNYSRSSDHFTSHQEIIDVLTTRTPGECESYLRRRVIESGFASMNRTAKPDLWE
jgi:DNA-binding GntR family transcriptional regulator